MNLTKREKFLLTVLGIITVISVYVVFILLPLYNTYTLNKSDLKAQQEIHTSIEETIKRFGTFEDDIVSAKKEADQKLKEVLPTRVNDKVYEHLIILAEEAGNKIINSSITDHKIYLVSPELPEASENDPEQLTSYTLKEALYLVNGIEIAEPKNPTVNEVYLEENTVEIEITGTTETLGVFLDAIIAENKTMKTIGVGRNEKENTYLATIKVYSTQGME